jgi:hypothetical protein
MAARDSHSFGGASVGLRPNRFQKIAQRFSDLVAEFVTGPQSTPQAEEMEYPVALGDLPCGRYSANTSCRVVRTADRVFAVTAPSRLTRRILSTVLI